jgi:hypothetical protein
MGYFVEFVAPVLDYLDKVSGLTDDDRSAIANEIMQELSKDADRFFALFPLSHESLYFWYDYAYSREDKIYDFDFIVDASHLEMGVVRVVYVECDILPFD